MPQGRRRHKKESKGFKPWQAARWQLEVKPEVVPAPRKNTATRKRSKVEPVDPSKIDNSYRASLQLLVRESLPDARALPDTPIRISGFRRFRSRVPTISNARTCDGMSHIWRDIACVHGDARTVIFRKCRDCKATTEWILEMPAAIEHAWTNTCHGAGCDLEALEGDDFCAFHEMEQGTERAPELRLPANLERYGMTMNKLPVIHEQVWVVNPEDKAFQILGLQEGPRIMTGAVLRDLREQVLQAVTNGRGEIDWNAKPDYSILRRSNLV